MGWARAAPADSGDARWSGCCACCCSCCPSGSSAADEWYWWWCINGGGTDVERPLARQRCVLCSGFRVRCKTVCSLGIRADIYLLAVSPLGGRSWKNSRSGVRGRPGTGYLEPRFTDWCWRACLLPNWPCAARSCLCLCRINLGSLIARCRHNSSEVVFGLGEAGERSRSG